MLRALARILSSYSRFKKRMWIKGNLSWAASEGRIQDVIDIYNADRDILKGTGCSSARYSGIKADRVEVIQTLWNLGARLEDWGSGMTELHLAAGLGSEEVARYLIAHGYSVNAIQFNGNTPL